MEPREINDLTLPIKTHKPCPPGCTPATRAGGLESSLVSVTVLYLEPALFSLTYDLLLELVYVLNNFSHLYRKFSLPSSLLLYHPASVRIMPPISHICISLERVQGFSPGVPQVLCKSLDVNGYKERICPTFLRNT